MFLVPLRDRLAATTTRVKFFEIGLGCGCEHCFGNGSSIAVWRTLFNNDIDLWVAEFDEQCAAAYAKAGITAGAHVLTGDQGKRSDVERWVRESGGNFHVVVDDGGHKNHQIKASFDVLWSSLLPGGLYFIEDLQIGRMWRHHGGTPMSKVPPFVDVVHAWVDALAGVTPPKRRSRTVPPLPHRLKWLMCQAEACVFAKCALDDPVC